MCPECDTDPAPQRERESYKQAKDKFLDSLNAREEFYVWEFVENLELRPSLDALSLTTELQRLCQLRANDAQLAKEERIS